MYLFLALPVLNHRSGVRRFQTSNGEWASVSVGWPRPGVSNSCRRRCSAAPPSASAPLGGGSAPPSPVFAPARGCAVSQRCRGATVAAASPLWRPRLVLFRAVRRISFARGILYRHSLFGVAFKFETYNRNMVTCSFESVTMCICVCIYIYNICIITLEGRKRFEISKIELSMQAPKTKLLTSCT